MKMRHSFSSYSAISKYIHYTHPYSFPFSKMNLHHFYHLLTSLATFYIVITISVNQTNLSSCTSYKHAWLRDFLQNIDSTHTALPRLLFLRLPSEPVPELVYLPSVSSQPFIRHLVRHSFSSYIFRHTFSVHATYPPVDQQSLSHLHSICRSAIVTRSKAMVTLTHNMPRCMFACSTSLIRCVDRYL